jgi:hypothetical protein
MKDSTGPWLILVGPLVFLVFVFFTRARSPRIFAALLGGVAAGALNIAWDLLGHRQGWWWYPGMDGRGYGPLVWYVTGGLAFGGGFGLVGWRERSRSSCGATHGANASRARRPSLTTAPARDGDRRDIIRRVDSYSIEVPLL